MGIDKNLIHERECQVNRPHLSTNLTFKTLFYQIRNGFLNKFWKRAPKIVALLLPSIKKGATIFGACLQPIPQCAWICRKIGHNIPIAVRMKKLIYPHTR